MFSPKRLAQLCYAVWVEGIKIVSYETCAALPSASHPKYQINLQLMFLCEALKGCFTEADGIKVQKSKNARDRTLKY